MIKTFQTILLSALLVSCTEKTKAVKKHSVRLLRNATLFIDFNGTRLLVDPILGAAGTYDAYPFSGNDYRNPLVNLPLQQNELDSIISMADAVLLTHTHNDHWDKKAQEIIPKNLIIFCQPKDSAEIAKKGFTNVQPIYSQERFKNAHIFRTKGHHGFGEVEDMMGSVSGYILKDSTRSLYISGDTRWCKEVKETLNEHLPDLTVVNAGEARFSETELPAITMTSSDIDSVILLGKSQQIMAVHMNAINHCHLKRKHLFNHLKQKDFQDKVIIPEDGETVWF